MDYNTRQLNAINTTDKNVLCLAAAASGKSLPDSEIIPTPAGPRRVSQIKPGDYLFNREGKPTKVLRIFPQGKLQVYLLKLQDGRTARCSLDHIWYVYNDGWSKRSQCMTTKQILQKQRSNSSLHFYLPIAEPVQYEKKNYAVPPYVIGAFLLSGVNTIATLSLKASKAVAFYVAKLINATPIKNTKTSLWNFNRKDKMLSPSDILPQELLVSFEKRTIPEEYKYGAVEQRLDLIRGLVDTISLKSKDKELLLNFDGIDNLELLWDIQEILNSLSYPTKILSEDNFYYNLSISIPSCEKSKLFLKRTSSAFSSTEQEEENPRKVLISSIVDLNYKEDMTCFLVDNEEHLFLTHDFIVTHNTATLTGRVEKLLDSGVHPSYLVAFTFTNQAAQEMKKRLGAKCRGMFIGTIHSYANKICTLANISTQEFIKEEHFDEIIKKALIVPTRKYPEVKYLFVDEFQDTDPIQYQFMKKIPAENRFYIGDERQFIYSFRGATDTFIRHLATDESFKKYYLEENYRNPANILHYADDFLSTMPKISPPSVPMITGDGFLDEHCKFADAVEEITWNMDDLTGWTIICRTNSEIENVQKALFEKDIPQIVVRRRDLDLETMKNLLDANRVKIMTIHSCMASNTLVPTLRGIKTIKEIVEEEDYTNLVYNGIYYDRVKNFIDNGIELTYRLVCKSGKSIRLTAFHDVITLDKGQLKKIKVKDLKGNEKLLSIKSIQPFTKFSIDNYNVEELDSIVPYGDEHTYCLTMEHESQFLQNGFLMGNSKGLEFPRVIVVGAKTFNFEERRIAYVAATRAKEALYWCPPIRATREKKKTRIPDTISF